MTGPASVSLDAARTLQSHAETNLRRAEELRSLASKIEDEALRRRIYDLVQDMARDSTSLAELSTRLARQAIS